MPATAAAIVNVVAAVAVITRAASRAGANVSRPTTFLEARHVLSPTRDLSNHSSVYYELRT